MDSRNVDCRDHTKCGETDHTLNRTLSGTRLRDNIELHRRTREFELNATKLRNIDAYPADKAALYDYKSFSPMRAYDSVSQPVTNGTAPGRDVINGDKMPPIPEQKKPDKPNLTTPSEMREVITKPEDDPLRILATIEPRKLPTHQRMWHDRAVADVVVRGKIAAWGHAGIEKEAEDNSDAMQKKLAIYKESVKMPMPVLDQKAWNDFYTSTTTRGFKDVPFDLMLKPPRLPPATVEEAKPRFESHSLYPEPHRNVQAAETWKPKYRRNERTWGELQMRVGSYAHGSDLEYCAPNKRASQIPGYSGFIGSDRTESIDNPHEAYRPFTVKRNETPSWAKSSWSPQIPHFAGHIPGARV